MLSCFQFWRDVLSYGLRPLYFDKPDPPQPPDPFRVAAAEAAFNRINQITPFGSLTFQPPTFGATQGQDLLSPAPIGQAPSSQTRFPSLDPATNQAGGINPNTGQPFQTGGGLQDPNQLASATAVLEFSPEVQALFEQQLGVSGAALSEAQRRQQAIAGGNLPELISELDPTGIQEVQRAIFEQGRGLLDPIFAERERELLTRLSNQGIAPGSEAFDFDVLQGLERERGRAFGDLGLQSILAGRQQGIAEQLTGANLAQTARGQLLNELAQVLGQQQIATPGLQNFFAPGQVDVSGAFGLNQQAQNNAFNAQLGLRGDIFGGLLGLGEAAIGLLG